MRRNIVFFLTKVPPSITVCATSREYLEAIFMSDVGRLKDDDAESGRSVSDKCLRSIPCSSNISFCRNSQGNKASYSPFMTADKRLVCDAITIHIHASTHFVFVSALCRKAGFIGKRSSTDSPLRLRS